MELIGIIETDDVLGEGPVWSISDQALYWVDIGRDLLQKWEFETKQIVSWQMPSTIGSFSLRESGGFLVALRTGLAFFQPEGGELKIILNPEEDLSQIRFNDGKCDRKGRFWVGTMDEVNYELDGSLYCLNIDKEILVKRRKIGISNGLGWSPDNSVFYYTDSAQRTIWAYDFKIDSGEISNERIFTKTPEDYVPDGLTVDSGGYVWSAKWDGWKVVRYSPNGQVDMTIFLPVQRPTSCIFGGPKLDLLFVTSARIDLDEPTRKQQPNAGNIFIFDSGFTGIPEPKFLG